MEKLRWIDFDVVILIVCCAIIAVVFNRALIWVALPVLILGGVWIIYYGTPIWKAIYRRIRRKR